jgi:redox-sensitive bicupin YhaK (pirin superfamily)
VMIVLEGEVHASNGMILETGNAVAFASNTQDTFAAHAVGDRARIAVVAGQQLHQPILAYGPLMLATEDALDTARNYVATLSI